jgi:hypothetical protein
MKTVSISTRQCGHGVRGLFVLWATIHSCGAFQAVVSTRSLARSSSSPSSSRTAATSASSRITARPMVATDVLGDSKLKKSREVSYPLQLRLESSISARSTLLTVLFFFTLFDMQRTIIIIYQCSCLPVFCFDATNFAIRYPKKLFLATIARSEQGVASPRGGLVDSPRPSRSPGTPRRARS